MKWPRKQSSGADRESPWKKGLERGGRRGKTLTLKAQCGGASPLQTLPISPERLLLGRGQTGGAASGEGAAWRDCCWRGGFPWG